ncbi:MAG TPA: SRPBCC domain-containing protein [Dehalococcoidia bacterium]|nr:SRPBCC domain-containing protein [Dehalococcoidia bacterium]
MRFEHKVTVPAPKQKVRDFLDDFEKAAKCVPGLQTVTEVEPGVFDGTVRVKIGPLGINIGGRAKLEKGADEAWRVQGEGRDRRIGAGVTANVEAKLNEVDANTTDMSLIADVQFSGRLAELGQPLIKRKADSFVQEFAQNLRKALS